MRKLKWTIYSLLFPNGKRYVGVTKCNPSIRLAQHMKSADKGSSCTIHAAIRKYGKDLLSLETLAECNTEIEAKNIEVKFIAKLNTMRPLGYNSTVGGNGVIDPTGLSSIKQITNMKKTMATEEYKEKQRRVQAIAWNSDLRKLRAEQTKALWSDPEYRMRLKLAHIKPEAKCHREKVLLSPEERSARAKAIWSRPGHHDRMVHIHKQVQGTDESRKEASVKQKNYLSNPVNRQKHITRMREVMNQPEVRDRCSLAHRRTA